MEKGVCPKCYGEQKRKEEAEKPLELQIDCEPFEQRIILHFHGDTMPVKNEIKAIGYRWDEMPMHGFFGSINATKPLKAWNKVVSMDGLEKALKEAEALNPKITNNITDLDKAAYMKIYQENQRKKAEADKRKQEKQEAISKLTKPDVPGKLRGHRWNGKIYGKADNYSVFLDNERVSITNVEAAEIESYQEAKEAYDQKVKEIEKIYLIRAKDREKGKIMTSNNDLEKKYGSVNYDGVKYVMEEDAYYSYDDHGGHYQASARRVPPIIDDAGDEVSVMVLWDIRDDYDQMEGAEESDACDWGKPASVHIGGYWHNGQFVPSSDN
jgi:hypothetical protein